MASRTYFIYCCILLALLGFSSGCSVKKMPLVPPAQPDASVLDFQHKPAPLAFDKAIATIPRGKQVMAYYTGSNDNLGPMQTCNYFSASGSGAEWAATNFLMANSRDELGSTFHDILTNQGYDVVGDPKSFYNREERRDRAKYSVSARITNYVSNICKVYNWFLERNEGTETGEGLMDVEWIVYDHAKRKPVLTVGTKGYAKNTTPGAQVSTTLMRDAFAAATEQLGVDSGFHALIAGPQPDLSREAAKPVSDAPIYLSRKNTFTTPFARHSGIVNTSVVTIVGAESHGSGFVISKDGYILTNWHVVDTADEVVVRFSNGMELPAKVLRRHEHRDVALLQVPVNKTVPLPLQTALPNIAAEVYAVGAPLDQSLHSTVSKGIISALRKKGNDLMLIQGDVDIHQGNSGGPLLDSNGNVIGISVSAVLSGNGPTGVGLNFFIPIKDALDTLNIRLGKPKKQS